MKDNIIKGTILLITDSQNNLIDDIDTDQIFHNRYLSITEIEQMGQYAFTNLKGWEDFSKKVKERTVIVVGKNFGAGSSRQQAVDCFISLGLSGIIAESYGAIYKRNAINSGFPIISGKEIKKIIIEGRLKNGDEVRINLRTGTIHNETHSIELRVMPCSTVQMDIYRAGNLFNF